jgi:hypothetical protein
LRQNLLAVALFGVPDTIPVTATETTNSEAETSRNELRTQAERVIQVIDQRLQEATLPPATDPADVQTDKLADVARAIFGSAFKLLPFFKLRNTTEVELALDNSAINVSDAPPLAIDEWLQSVSMVRPQLANYQTVRLLAETFDGDNADAVGLAVAQLPFQSGDRWLGLPFTTGSLLTGNHLLLVLQVLPSYSTSTKQSGLMLDDWVEVVPLACAAPIKKCDAENEA